MAIAHGFLAAAEFGMKEHQRLALARTMMVRKPVGGRTSSKLPGLIELVMARPLVSAAIIATELGVTPRAALRIVDASLVTASLIVSSFLLRSAADERSVDLRGDRIIFQKSQRRELCPEASAQSQMPRE